MSDNKQYKWLLITTDNLPEAYVMANYLLSESQDISIFNIKRRSYSQSKTVLKRLAKKRGIIYLIDFLLAKQFKKYYQKPDVKIFPKITNRLIEDIISRVNYFEVNDPHCEETIDLTKQLKPDYILFLGAPVIKPSLFSLSKYGTINWHHGLAPLYRGSDCVLWPMANNDFYNIGFTIHSVVKVVDGGTILLQRKIPVKKNLDFSNAIADILRQGMDGFIEVVSQILSNKDLKGQEQERGGFHYPPAGLSTIRRACNNYRKLK